MNRARSGVIVLGLLIVLGGTGIAEGSPSAAPSPAGEMSVAELPKAVTTPTEDKYVPITPCRIVDTRGGTGTGGTPLSSLQTRTYYVGGTFGFAPQGGKAGGCGIPVGATAISATLTAVDPTNGGFLRAWPNGQTEPAATLLNYPTTSASTGAAVTINPATAYSMKVRNYSGPTDLVIDVAGYFIKPMAALIQSDGITYDGTSRVINSGRLGVGQYWVELDRDITYCQAVASAYNVASFARVDTFTDPSTARIRVILYNAAGVAIDGWFYIIVSC